MKKTRIIVSLLFTFLCLNSFALAANELPNNDSMDTQESLSYEAGDVANNEISEVETAISTRAIDKYRVTGNGVRVRAEAGLNGTPIGQMNWGDVCYTAYPDSGPNYKYADGFYWQYVLCGAPLTGQKGWIATLYLEFVPT